MIPNIVLVLFTLSVIPAFSTDMSDNSFGQYNDGILAAFGDFNSDELTDTFVIKNQTNLQVYLAYDKEPFLRPSGYACNFSDWIITSVVPGDYDGDAFMDILITTVPKDIPLNTSGIQNIRILWGGMQILNCSNASVIKASSIGQPLIIDYNHDMILDIFGSNIVGDRVFWIFNHSREIPTEVPFGDYFYKPVQLPHSHSFLDINSDNVADLMVSTKFGMEIWYGNSIIPGFDYGGIFEIPIGREWPVFGQVIFLDMALSGQFSPILPVCFDANCFNSSLHIYIENNWQNLLIDFNDGKGTTWRLVPPRSEVYLDAITMRSGDFNMDGYPDILLTLSPENSNETEVFLLQNSPCDFAACNFHRTYKIQWDKFSLFGRNAVMAVFYDFYMDGVLDIIYVKKNTTTNSYAMHAYKNELEYDTNFIKVIVVTGLTNEHAPRQNMLGAWKKKRGTYGTNLPGPKIGYSTLSQEGNYRTGVCAQLSQSAYFALQLPYSIFGLDRTPNFVDSLRVGLAGYSKTWTQIIPNSQIVVIPYPKDDASQWRAQLFVTPSKLVLRSLFVLTAIIVVIIGCASYLHWRERNDRQDIIEIDASTYVRI